MDWKIFLTCKFIMYFLREIWRHSEDFSVTLEFSDWASCYISINIIYYVLTRMLSKVFPSLKQQRDILFGVRKTRISIAWSNYWDE